MISFAVQKLLSLIRLHLFIFAFISIPLGDCPRKYCYNLCQRMFCLCSLLGILWCPVRVGLWRRRSTKELMLLWCWRRLLRVPWTARRSNQSILKEISPGISLEGMMLKQKLQYFGHLMRRVDSLEKTLILGGIGGRRRRGRPRMASQTRWTWVWVNSGRWWWTGGPGVLRFRGLQRVRHNWATELNWTDR